MMMANMAPHYVPLIDYGSHGSTLYTPPMMMATLDPHYVPLIDDVSHGLTICPTQL